MKYFLYIFYRYYKNGKYETVPYMRAVSNLTFFIFLNLFAICIFIFPNIYFLDADIFALIFVGWLTAVYFLIWYFIKEKDLQNPELEKRYKPVHGFLAIFYIIITMVLMVAAIKYHKSICERQSQKETINKENTIDRVIFKPLPDSITDEEIPGPQ